MLHSGCFLARAAGTIAVVLMIVLTGGCGDTGVEQGDTTSTTSVSTTSPAASTPPGGDDATTTVPPGTIQPPPAGTASEFVGLTKDEAIALAESQGRVWRIAREDDESYPLTLDYSETRVNFEIDDGKVTVATFG